MITENKTKAKMAECRSEDTLADKQKIKGLTKYCGCGCIPIPPFAVETSGKTDTAASCADK